MQAAARIEIHNIFLWAFSLSHFQKFQDIVADGVTFFTKRQS